MQSELLRRPPATIANRPPGPLIAIGGGDPTERRRCSIVRLEGAPNAGSLAAPKRGKFAVSVENSEVIDPTHASLSLECPAGTNTRIEGSSKT
jgi:hypothetical protein